MIGVVTNGVVANGVVANGVVANGIVATGLLQMVLLQMAWLQMGVKMATTMVGSFFLQHFCGIRFTKGWLPCSKSGLFFPAFS